MTLQVHHAARRADHDLGASLEGAHLWFERFTAHDQRELDAARIAQLLEHVVDLLRQLARRCQDQPEHRRTRRIDLGHHGRAEGQRLARAGLGLGNHIASIQDRLDRQALNRGGDDDPHVRDGVLDVVAQSELAERAHIRHLHRRLEGRHIGRRLGGGGGSRAIATTATARLTEVRGHWFCQVRASRAASCRVCYGLG